MDSHELKFDSERFDGAFAMETMVHMKKLIALKELHRILKDKGV